MTSASTTGSTAPQQVVTAYRLYLASAVLGLVGLVVSLVLLPQAIDAALAGAQEQLRGQDTGGVDVVSLATGAAIGAAVVAAVIAVAFAVLTIVFARKLLPGRNWARIVLAVFAGLHLLGLVGLLAAPSVPEAVVSLLQAGTAVAAAVLTFLPASNPHFRRTLLPATSV